ncbi:MAG: PAS domain S-box protein [Thiomargarita sp.]|nr:PAS domain S-box protein [Thiomargarita sp.]
MSHIQTHRILYIEDDIITASYVQKHLEQHNYVVDLAMDGREGINKLHQNNYDIVVVDYHLPGMNGLQVLQYISKAKINVAGIMLTGAGDERIAVEAIKSGAGDYLIKDVNNNYLQLLPEVIECQLQRQELIQQKKQNETALHDRDTILEAVSFAAEQFLTCKYWEQSIQEVLTYLGQAATVSRAYIFENYYNEQQELLANQRYEWVADGINAEINNQNFQNITYEPHFGIILKNLKQGLPFCGLVKNFSPVAAEILKSQNIISIIFIPIFVNKKFWGFIGYDDCKTAREWSSSVIDAFKTAASLLGTAIQQDQINYALQASENSLSENTQTLTAILNAATDSIVMMELDTTCVVINPAGAERLNKTVNDVIGQQLCNLISPEIANRRKKAVEQVIKTKQAILFEDEESQDVWFEHSIYPMLDNAEVNRIAIVSRNISERKLAENNLRKERDFTNAIINTAGNLIVVLDIKGAIIRFNQACEELTGYVFAEVKNQYIWDIFLAEECISPCKNYFSDIILNRPFRIQHETYWVAKDNTRYLINWFHTILLDDNGEAKYIIGTGIDITASKETQNALEHTLDELQAILDNSPVGIAFLDNKQQFIQVNDKLEEMFGYSESEFKEKTANNLYFSFEDYEKTKQVINSTLKKGQTHRSEDLMRHKDISKFWCQILIKAVNPNDLSQGTIWHYEDVTAQRHTKKRLRLASTVFDTITEGIVVTNKNNQIIMVNPAFTTITGYSFQEVAGRNPRLLKSGHQTNKFYENMWQQLLDSGKWQDELWNKRKDGEVYAEWKSIVVIRDANNKIIQYVSICTDITERKRNQELIWHQANYDALTNLPNRTLFAENSINSIRIAKSKLQLLAIIFIDLDRFKWVNDTLGHDVGDKLLVEAAERLKQCLRETDTIARFGGDEFTVIVNDVVNIIDIEIIVKRMLNNLSQAFILEKQEVFIAGSIGIAMFPKDGTDGKTLLKKADIAMYQAKEGGRNTFRFFKTENIYQG